MKSGLSGNIGYEAFPNFKDILGKIEISAKGKKEDRIALAS